MIWLIKHCYWLVLFVPRKIKHKMMWIKRNAPDLGYDYALEFYNKHYDYNN